MTMHEDNEDPVALVCAALAGSRVRIVAVLRPEEPVPYVYVLT